MLSVTLNNGLSTTSPDYFAVTVDAAGSTDTTSFDGVDTIYQYNAFFDDGQGTVNDLTDYGSAPTLQSNGTTLSTGTFSVGSSSVSFKVVSTLSPGTKAFLNTYSFTVSGSYNLTSGRLFQYEDSDISSASSSFTSNVLTVGGATAGTGSNKLVLTTIDPASNIRQAQENGPTGTNSALAGYAADEYDNLEQNIDEGGFSAPASGNINTTDLPPENVSGIGAAFGPNDITTALAYKFTNASTATLTTSLGIDTEVAGAPEIDIQGLGTSILDGDTTPQAADNTLFTATNVGTTLDHTFAVDNIGTASLTISGSPHVKISGANASDFSVVTQTAGSVAADGTSPFVIAFKPTAAGVRKATVTILNNDSNEGTYTFSIQGTGVAVANPTSLVVTPPANQTATAAVGKSFNLGSLAATNATAPYTVDVSWGDGSTDTSFTTTAAGTLAAHSHTFAAAGTDTVTVTVTDSADHTSNHATFLVAVTSAVVSPTGSISGTVYKDLCGDGLTSDDTALSGATVSLYADTNGNGTLGGMDTLVGTKVSGSTGTYSFTGLSAGKYFVKETVPAGDLLTAPTTSTYYVVNLAASGQVSQENFDNFIKPTSRGVTGIIYHVNGHDYADLRHHTAAGETVSVTFTVTNPAGEMLSLVSYSAPSATFSAATAAQQRVFQSVSHTYAAGTYTISITLPTTGHYQVDFVTGCVISQFGPAMSNIFYTPQNRLLSADNE